MAGRVDARVGFSSHFTGKIGESAAKEMTANPTRRGLSESCDGRL
jgi:hypothetical protein